MPSRALACRCGGRVISGNCNRCGRRRAPHREAKRPSASQRGYDVQWRKVRLAKLRRDPLCEPCIKKGFYVAAVEVHHKTKFKRNGVINHKLRLSMSNLESCCNPCHQAYSRRGE